jgi:hypothetical protein
MSPVTFEQIRLPVAVVLVAIAAFVFFPRGGGEAGPTPEPTSSVVVGEPGGGVLLTPTPEASRTPIPTLAAVATPTPTSVVTPPPGDGDFSAEVLACRSISGSRCNDQLGTLPRRASSFTALVRFTDANAGDVLNAMLNGPSGRIDGFAYTLQGSGDGYYYTTFIVSGLPGGTYTVTATRNGSEVASTTLRKVGS